MANLHEQDPLAGDVERWVHPDETRTDAEIERDEKLAAQAHMSGADGADEYWADYDEYNGTVNGGEEPASRPESESSRAEEARARRMARFAEKKAIASDSWARHETEMYGGPKDEDPLAGDVEPTGGYPEDHDR